MHPLFSSQGPLGSALIHWHPEDVFKADFFKDAKGKHRSKQFISKHVEALFVKSGRRFWTHYWRHWIEKTFPQAKVVAYTHNTYYALLNQQKAEEVRLFGDNNLAAFRCCELIRHGLAEPLKNPDNQGNPVWPLPWDINGKQHMLDIIAYARRFPHHLAMRTALYEGLKPLLEQTTVTPVQRLLWAAHCGQEEVAQAQLAHLAEATKTGEDTSHINMLNDLLLWGARGGYIDIAQIALQAGANANHASTGGTTVLIWAASRGHTDIVTVLLQVGADPNQVTDRSDTALIKAAIREHTDVITALLRAGADPNHANRYGVTALNKAAQRGHTPITALLHCAEVHRQLASDATLGKQVAAVLNQQAAGAQQHSNASASSASVLAQVGAFATTSHGDKTKPLIDALCALEDDTDNTPANVAKLLQQSEAAIPEYVLDYINTVVLPQVPIATPRLNAQAAAGTADATDATTSATMPPVTTTTTSMAPSP